MSIRKDSLARTRFRIGAARIYPDRLLISLDGEEHAIEPRVMEVLIHLAENANATHSAEAIAEAFAAALPRIGELTAQSAMAAARYRAANGAAALIDQVAALWVRHKAAASLVARPATMAIDLARLDGGWHIGVGHRAAPCRGAA